MKNKLFIAFALLFIGCTNSTPESVDNQNKLVLLSVYQKFVGNLSLFPDYITKPAATQNSLTLIGYTDSSSSILLSWNDFYSAVEYRVYRDVTSKFTPNESNEVKSSPTAVTLVSPRGNLTTPLVPSTTLARNNSGISKDTTYYYVISVKDNNGKISYSNEVSVTLPSTVYTVNSHAGSGLMGAIDGDGYDARFYYPMGISVDGDGFIYVADSWNQMIRKVSKRVGDIVNSGGTAYAIEGQVSTIGGTGAGVWGNSNSNQSATSSFMDPWANCAIGTISSTTPGTYDGVYIADSSNHSIRKMDFTGKVTTIAGTPSAASSNQGTTDGIGTSAKFNYPKGITCDSINNLLYVADTMNNLIRKIDLTTNTVTTISGTAGQSGQGSTDGLGTSALFAQPNGIHLSGTNLYVADTNNHKIRKIDLSTNPVTVTTLAGSGIQGKLDATGTAATFGFPRAVAASSTGNVYVADSANHSIRKITSAGVVTTIAGSGEPGNRDGINQYSNFRYPQGIALFGTSLLYISDTSNHKIRRISGSF